MEGRTGPAHGAADGAGRKMPPQYENLPKMAKLKRDTDVKDEMYTRVKKVYGVFILVALLVVVRLVWVSALSSETAYNAGRLERRIFIADSV